VEEALIMKRIAFVFLLFLVLLLTGISYAYWLSIGSAMNSIEVDYNKNYWLYSESTTGPVYKSHSIDPDGNDLYGLPVPPGSWVDKAWNIETGDPSVVIAIIDTGIRWENVDKSLVNRFYINKGEVRDFPPLKTDVDFSSPQWGDVNGDAAFNSGDYQYVVESYIYDKYTKGLTDDELRNEYPDYMIKLAEDAQSRPGKYKDVLDLQKLIKRFSNGEDNDHNGFVDDICGWNFFEDNNDPGDVSSYSSATYHGTGQTISAVGEFRKSDEVGVCPNCTVMPLKSWDSFVQDTNYYGLAALYAARNGAHVIEGALGGLNNSGVCKAALKEAYNNGLAIFIASSDLNSADHNFPTYLDEPIYCSGMVPDTFGMQDSIAPKTYFRNAGTCQFGAKNHISWEVATGSQSTALSSGAGGLLMSHARKMGLKLHSDQIKQLLTLTCDDILPEDTKGYGDPDPALMGWDQHFGYGRVNLYAAMKALNAGIIPSVVRITSPEWSHYFDLRKSDTLLIIGDILSGSENINWIVEAGAGIEPAKFTEISHGSTTGKNIVLANIDLSEIKNIFPQGTDFSYFPNSPEDKYPGDANIQPNRFLFTIRVRLTSAKLNDKAFREPYKYPEDRRTFYICEDKSLHDGWPKYIGVGGEASLRFDDLDGDGKMEVILATSDGRILIYRHDGSTYSVNGKPVEFAADTFDLAANHRMTTSSGMPFRSTFITPAIADIDGDGIKEIVSAADGKVYCFKADGKIQPGFPIDFSENFKLDVFYGKVKNSDHSTNPDGSLSGVENVIGPGTMAAPLLYDLDGDGKKEIIVAGNDQRLYVWKSDGTNAKGFPVYVRSNEMYGNKIIYPPCLADIDDDGKMEIIIATNEAIPIPGMMNINLFGAAPQSEENYYFSEKGITSGGIDIMPSVLNIVNRFIGKKCLVYAIKSSGAVNGDGGRSITASQSAFVKGWPAGVEAFVPDMLPLLGPSSKPCAFDYNGDGKDEVVASFTSGKTSIIDGNGKIVKQMVQGPFGNKAVGMNDRSLVLNLFESAALGDITGDGTPQIIKGGLSLFGALNLGLSGQNLPYNYAIQVWDSQTGKFLESFPRAIDDYVMYSEPSIADVDGDGIPDIIVGSELYLLHAFGSDGMDKTGFPKMAAGSMMTTPAVADLDGDGNNEVGVATREGWVFVWNTKGKYTTKANWPTYGHDNCNTSNLRVDAVSPASVTEYTWTDDGLVFKCPGDDGYNGKAKEIKVFGSNIDIDVTTIKEATLIKQIKPVTGGAKVYVNIPNNFSHYAVIAYDESGNSSQLPLIPGGIKEVRKLSVESTQQAQSDNSSGSSSLCFVNTAITL
jgi:FG-GAP-like repeat/Subtilase family